MSLFDYKETLKLLKESECYFSGKKTESLVVAAEQKLGVVFPPSYRQFLLDFGGGIFGSAEIYGIIDFNFETTIPNGIWMTLQARKDMNLDKAYIIVSDVGDGSFYALDTRITDKDGENPVVVVSVETDVVEIEAPSFGTFFLNEVKRAL